MKRDRILLASSALQFALFIPLAWWARKHRQSLREIAISRLAQKKQPAFARNVVYVLNTVTGSAVILNLLVVPVAAVLWQMRLRLEAVMALASCWLNALSRTIIKQAIHRPRPHSPLVRTGKQSKGKSFPSGHVASAVCLWGWLFVLGLFGRNGQWPGRKIVPGIAAGVIAFTGPARVYLGDHWTTDVLGGYLFGGGWLGLSLGLYFRWREQSVLEPGQEWRQSDALTPYR